VRCFGQRRQRSAKSRENRRAAAVAADTPTRAPPHVALGSMTSALLSARIHAPLAASSASPRGAGRARRLRARGARRAAPVAFAAVVDVEQKCAFAAVPERWFALTQARSCLHWSPYDRVRVVNADP
jgi:hypothetical protein